MRHFIYTYSEHTPRGGHTQKTVHVYRIKRNRPERVATRTETFVSEFQLVMMALEAIPPAKGLPRKAFERSKVHGGFIHGAAHSLRDAGIATIDRV